MIACMDVAATRGGPMVAKNNEGAFTNSYIPVGHGLLLVVR